MSYLTKMKLNGVSYDIRDAEAYKAINILNGDSTVVGSVQKQITDALMNLKATSFRIVDQLPKAESAEDGVIYLVSEDGTKSGTYIEYIKVESIDGTVSLEKIGSTDMDLSDYETRVDAFNLARAIILANEFIETDDIIAKDGYSYITLTGDGKANIGIDRTIDTNIVYVRENIVYQSELANLQSRVDDLKEKEENDVKIINERIDQEVDDLNRQTTVSSYVTIEMESDNIGTIVATDVSVLQPKSSIIEKDTTWFDTAKSSFSLSKPEQLLGLSDLVRSGEEDFIGKTIVLSDDINLQGQEFKPIGDVHLVDPTKSIYSQTSTGNAFQGTFDGNGHTISNIRITKPSGAGWDNTGIGLFGLVTGETTIKNLNVSNLTITAPTSKMVGTVIGYACKTNTEKVTTIENVNITGTIQVSGNIGVGAIVGRTEVGNKLIMRNCSVIGNDPNTSYIEATYKDAFAGVGGLIGACYGNADNEITNCIVKNITIKAPDEGVGGLAGHFERGILSNNTVQNVKLINSINTSLYMQEAVSIGVLAGTIDSSIKANGGSSRVSLSGNIIRDVDVHIPSTYTNTGNASGVALDENGYPNWKAWPILGTPRNVEYRDVTEFATATNPDWDEMKNNVNIIKD